MPLSSLSLSALALALAGAFVPLVEAMPPQAGALRPRDGVNLGFPYGQEKVRGVNLGGWLVLEPWITPNLFDPLPPSIVDEYTFGRYQDRAIALATLTTHWNTFITEDDFRQIAEAGLNHVRLPIGYWAFDVSGGEPYIQGQKPFLYKAITWAKTHGIKVMIDLHGAPGSQNGYDNSGQRGSALWATQQSNVDRTKAIIASLAKEFSDPQYFGIVTALEIMNEPAGYLNSQLLDTYKQFAIDEENVVRYPSGGSSKSGLMFTYSDAFQGAGYWENTFSKTEGALQDIHFYQIFSEPELSRTWSEHLKTTCDYGTSLKQYTGNVIVGEWTPTVYDCAKHLNGRGNGARYDGSYAGSTRMGDCAPFTGDGSTFSDDYKNFLRTSWDTQTQTFEAAGAGWAQWAWRADNAVEWSYKSGIAGGWIPKNAGDHLGYSCS